MFKKKKKKKTKTKQNKTKQNKLLPFSEFVDFAFALALLRRFVVRLFCRWRNNFA
jgi:hypothetical protein